MIRHIVMWRLKPEAVRADGIENIERIRRSVAEARAGIPGLLELELGVNEAPGSDAADLVLLAQFDSWEALRGYESHPLHAQLRALIGPLRVERRVVDYQSA
jgi:hypothetical protein